MLRELIAVVVVGCGGDSRVDDLSAEVQKAQASQAALAARLHDAERQLDALKAARPSDKPNRGLNVHLPSSAPATWRNVRIEDGIVRADAANTFWCLDAPAGSVCHESRSEPQCHEAGAKCEETRQEACSSVLDTATKKTLLLCRKSLTECLVEASGTSEYFKPVFGCVLVETSGSH